MDCAAVNMIEITVVMIRFWMNVDEWNHEHP